MKKKMIMGIVTTVLAFSVISCGNAKNEENVTDEEVAVEQTEAEEVNEEIVENESNESVSKAENSTGAEKENEEVSRGLSETASKITHAYTWKIFEFEGEHDMEFSIRTNGIPSVANSTIEFEVTYSIFDHKIFSTVKYNQEVVIDKETNPELLDLSSSEDGVIGYEGDKFKLSSEGTTNTDESIPIVFSYMGMDGKLREFGVVWLSDGSVGAMEGDLYEQ